ncbi:exonuclease SbcCD subunit D [Streptacidiphilus sp. PB12-B1b]|uniref:exonuclease SbcCD subunit D n=1 Tax=Streptacidiphilus sp. PB12-B1b TaxID=2705012 RepID=UPI0015FC9C07|nr:exonuclease SbcCD subunit D [Streptacidiphilus sp. PB12-B1b]QMU77578.1 exonuclease SbcCD subunit D [Streptacidiphilus sp. PB12-B1b]
MRLLHTSDWHLGRSLHREDLLPAQAAFLDHLVETARAEQVDAVLVAGDVHDRAIPSLGAVELFDRALQRLARLSVPTVLISGNHDSARRLGIAARLIERSGVHLRTDVARCDEPVLLEDAHGTVAVYGVPYLEPALTAAELGAERVGHAAVLGAAMARIRADLATRPGSTRSVVLAHAFVVGGEASDSERDISVGGVPSVPASVFDGIDYTALGHLHGCQTLGERLRYSGSPLAYSFSEADHRKTMWLVDLGPGGEIDARRIDCPAPRRLRRLRGTLAELLADESLAGHREDWLEVTLTDAARPERAMEQLRARFPHTLQLAFDPQGRLDDGPVGYAARTRGLGDAEIALGFVRHVRGSAPDPVEEALLREATEAVGAAAGGED